MDPMLLIMMVVLFGGMYFLMIRPQQKKMRERQETLNAITEGERVMLTSGFFGTVRHLGDKQAVIELAPGLEITVVREAILKPISPDDEEFEFTDGSDADDLMPGAAGASAASGAAAGLMAAEVAEDFDPGAYDWRSGEGLSTSQPLEEADDSLTVDEIDLNGDDDTKPQAN